MVEALTIATQIGAKIVVRAVWETAKKLAKSNDRAVLEAWDSELEGVIFDLQSRVEKIEKSDVDLVQGAKILKACFEAVTDTLGDEKREAILGASAAQFDPTLGRKAVRDYWWRLTNRLTDAEIALVSLTGTGRLFFFPDRAIYWTSDPGPAGPLPQNDELVKLPNCRELQGYRPDDVATLALVARSLVNRNITEVETTGEKLLALAKSALCPPPHTQKGDAFRLTPFGLRFNAFLTAHPKNAKPTEPQ